MFDKRVVAEAAAEFPDLAAAIAAVPVRPEPGGSALAAGHRLQALLLLSRQLEARVAGHVFSFDRQGFASVDGAASTATWLRGNARVESGHGHRIVASGRVAEALPGLGQAFADGQIGAEHVEAVAMGSIGVPLEALAEHEPAILEFAPFALPSGLRRVAKRVQTLYDDEAVLRDAQHARDSRRLHLSQSMNGIWYVDGQLEAEAGAAIKAALDSLTPPLGPTDNRTPAQRRADALYELVQVALRSGQLPDAGGDRPRLTLVVAPGRLDLPEGNGLRPPSTQGATGSVPGLNDLAGALTGTGAGAAFARSAVAGFGACPAHLLGSDTALPAQTIERIGCDADINLAVQADDGEVLAFGRSRRFPSPAQRRVLLIRDAGCVFPGCDRPPSMCQAHHLRYWSDHGWTDLDNLALVCSFHHHLLHEDGWRLDRLEPAADPALIAGGWRATAPDGRQFRQPRRRVA